MNRNENQGEACRRNYSCFNFQNNDSSERENTYFTIIQSCFISIITGKIATSWREKWSCTGDSSLLVNKNPDGDLWVKIFPCSFKHDIFIYLTKKHRVPELCKLYELCYSRLEGMAVFQQLLKIQCPSGRSGFISIPRLPFQQGMRFSSRVPEIKCSSQKPIWIILAD